MGLHGDIEETKQAWKKVSWPMRAIYGLMLYLSISSIASLAQTVADWKDFFLTTVEFYQSVFRDPVLAFITEHTAVRLTKAKGDLMTLMLLAVSPAMSHNIRGFRSAIGTRQKLSMLGHILLAFSAPSALVLYLILQESSSLPLAPSYSFFIALYVAVIISIRKSGDHIAQAFVIVPPVTVALLAAINKGLSM